MPRRKTLFDKVFDVIEALGTLYVLAMFYWWFTDKDVFWKWLFYGITFFVIIFIIIIAITIWRRKTRFLKIKGWHSDRELLYWLRGMKPWEFEEYIAQLYSKLEYKTERVGGGYDGGVDVIAEKNGIKYYIQCKKYITSTVGVKEIREFYGVLVDHTAQGKGIFITTNIFSSESEYFSKDKPIELIDGQKLVRLIRQLEKIEK